MDARVLLLSQLDCILLLDSIGQVISNRKRMKTKTFDSRSALNIVNEQIRRNVLLALAFSQLL